MKPRPTIATSRVATTPDGFCGVLVGEHQGRVLRFLGTIEMGYNLCTLQWHRIVPHSAKLKSWTITPSHYLKQQLDQLWLTE